MDTGCYKCHGCETERYVVHDDVRDWTCEWLWTGAWNVLRMIVTRMPIRLSTMWCTELGYESLRWSKRDLGEVWDGDGTWDLGRIHGGSASAVEDLRLQWKIWGGDWWRVILSEYGLMILWTDKFIEFDDINCWYGLKLKFCNGIGTEISGIRWSFGNIHVAYRVFWIWSWHELYESVLDIILRSWWWWG